MFNTKYDIFRPIYYKDFRLSLKENIDAIKDELSTEEKFLESMIKGESFFKKNKKLIMLAGGAIIVGIIASTLYNYKKELDLKHSNEIYTKLLAKSDTKLELELKSKNPKLYTLYKFQTIVATNDINKLKELSTSVKDPVLKDLVTYQIDSLSKKDLMKYVGNDGSFKEFALLQQAFIELENKNYEKAKEVLEFIPINSSLHQLSSALKHYNPKEK